MEERKIAKFVLDFSHCHSIGEIYEVIQKELNLPEWFGNNLSAFWDALTGMISVPAVIVFHKQTLNAELRSYLDKVIAVAHRAEQEEYLGITVIERD